MMLDLTVLENALTRMREALSTLDAPGTAQDPTMRRLVRTACVKTFECTYELSCKMIRRHLEMNDDTAGAVDQRQFFFLTLIP